MNMQELGIKMPSLLAHMETVGCSESYTAGVGRCYGWLLDHESEIGDWDDVDGVVDKCWDKESTRRGVRTQLSIIRAYDVSGTLPRTAPRESTRTSARRGLCPAFSEILDEYEASPAAASKRRSTVRGELSHAASFLSRLQGLGLTRVLDVTEADAIHVITSADGTPAFSATYVKDVRAVLAAAAGVPGCAELREMVQVPRRWRKVTEAPGASEVERVRDVLAGDDGLTRRDRAIGCVLLYTGMRACDVAALTRESLDWAGDRIELVQQKTGVTLSLPLLPQVGNAILDYARRERGRSGDPHVFLSLRWPYGGMSASSVSSVARRVLEAAGVRAGGSHVFRRTVATSMLGAGVDRSVVASTLGQADPQVTERYMSADVEGLRRRAVDVSRFPVTQGALS